MSGAVQYPNSQSCWPSLLTEAEWNAKNPTQGKRSFTHNQVLAEYRLHVVWGLFPSIQTRGQIHQIHPPSDWGRTQKANLILDNCLWTELGVEVLRRPQERSPCVTLSESVQPCWIFLWKTFASKPNSTPDVTSNALTGKYLQSSPAEFRPAECSHLACQQCLRLQPKYDY